MYSATEIYGSLNTSLDDAIENAVKTAGRTIRNIQWFEVTEIRGHIENVQVGRFRVNVKLNFCYALHALRTIALFGCQVGRPTYRRS